MAALVVILGTGLCAWMLYVYGCSPDVPRLDRSIREELPIGSTRAAVVSFLERHHVPVTDSNSISYYHGPRKVWGTVNEFVSLVCSLDTTFAFQFDDQDRLTVYEVKKRPICL